MPGIDGRQIHPLPAAATGRPNARADAPLAGAPEILFVDPSVADLGTIFANLRPEVEAILLDANRPAARQMALALEGRYGLDAVHVIAHGAPGRVNFAAGEWSAETLGADGSDLAAIGDALGGLGELLLWSCNAGAGGSNFIDALSSATGTPVAAANGLVGSPVLGGHWQLNVKTTQDAAARPPLTRGGIMSYAAVLAAIEITVSGLVPSGLAAGTTTYFVVDRDHGSIVGNINLPNMANRAFRITVRVPAGSTGLDVGVFDETGKFTSAGFTVDVPAPPSGAVGTRG
ncbi:DUF4347 domain-containing protein [Mesorhizobium intechi]|uniref:DUF4347 domain-containing protein n=1 Tax=Mesorhizobium intechi TaxID=537601 RepID=UPI00142F02E9|nr:DUF4347 domain-containing protein [Mesorhizobium intechi]